MMRIFTRILLGCILFSQANLALADSPDNTFENLVLCDVAPILTCPAVYFGCPGDDLHPDHTNGSASAVPGSSDCSKPIEISYSDDTISISDCNEITLHRTWSAAYAENSDPWLTSTCTQYIVLSDDEKPVFTNCPSDIAYNDVNCEIAVSWTLPTASDDCGIASLTSNYNPGDIFPIGTTTVTYVALDHCGNAETCSFNVIVSGGCCTEPLSIACPQSWWGCVGTGTHPDVTGYATAVTGDFCAIPDVTYQDFNIVDGPCTGATKLERVWTATDPNDPSRVAVCTQFIELSDFDAPVITNCPGDINGVEGETIVWSEPDISDLCNYTVDISHPNSSEFGVGCTTVTYTATDNCGNSATCSFVVCIEKLCDAIPEMSCPPTYTNCPTSSIHPNVTGHPIFSNTDPDCGILIVTYSDQESVVTTACSESRTIQRRWEAYYLQNPTEVVSCIQILDLKDVQAPVIVSCPSDLTVSAYNNGANVSWNPPIAEDECGGSLVYDSNYSPGDNFPFGSTTVNYNIKDACGNTVSCAFNILVEQACNAVPTINCPPIYRGCPNDSPHPDNTGWPTTSGADDVCGDVILDYSDMYSESYNDCVNSRKIVRMWYASYSNNPTQKNICIQVIELHDSQKPVLHNCPADITVTGSGNNVSWVAPAATDNCTGAVTIESSHPMGSSFPQGCSTVVYTATDGCGNSSTCSFKVCVEFCDQVPSINCPDDYVGCPGGSRDPDFTGYATTNAGSSASCGAIIITHNDQILTTYNSCSGAKKIRRTWKAYYQNNPTEFETCHQILDYRDETPPVFTSCPGNISLSAGNNVAHWTSPTVTDGCSTVNLTSNYGSGSTFPEGCTTVTYTAKDQCGNKTTCSFSVCVDASCSAIPELDCPANYNGCPGSSIDPIDTGSPVILSPASDCGAVTLTYEDITLQNYSCSNGKKIRRTWKASYAENSNNYSTCVQIIDLKDTTKPTLSNCPSDMLLIGGNDVAHWTAPSAYDACGISTLTSSHQSGTAFPVGCTTVTYTAKDNCNNVQICSFEVCVEQGGISNVDINCPDDYVVACTGSGTGAIGDWPLPTFNVSCNACDGSEIAGFVFMGTFDGHQYYCSTEPALWTTAQAKCASNGGYLAVISSSSENSFLANQLTTQSAYIGLSDKESEGTFRWVNDEPLDYINWYPGQPNNYNNSQDYVELLSNGQWNDQYNNIGLEYIMEIPCASLVQTAGPRRGSPLPLGTSTVEYTYSDACGNYGVCSFDVSVEPGLTIQCINDVTIACPNSDSGILVNWDEPMVNTCCSDCGVTGGLEIPGYMYMGSYGGSNYYCSEDKALWEDAKSKALTYGGNLAIINDAAENQFLSNILTIQSAYIGLSDHQSEGSFQWCNGTPLGSYTNWYPGQPNNYNNSQDYVEMLSNGKWNDQYNNKPLEYIMEIPSCINIAQTGGIANGGYFPVGTTTISYEATDGCGYTDWCSFNVTVVKTGCSSGGQSSDQAWIRNVQFSDINNSSGNNGGYKNFDNVCGSIAAGYTYNLALSPGYPTSTASNVYWKVYIDFNNDGDFTDSREYIATGSGDEPLKGNIKIPTAVWNVTTTMRVVMRKGAPPSGPCDVFSYGETEDYCIKVVGADFTSTNNGKSLTQHNDASLGTLLPVSEITRELTLEIEDNNESVVVANENPKEDIQKERTTPFTKANKLTVNVFPNPASDYIKIHNLTANTVESVQIFDSNGRVVITKENLEFINRDESIDISGLNTGFYIIRVKDESGQTVSKKLSVQKY